MKPFAQLLLLTASCLVIFGCTTPRSDTGTTIQGSSSTATAAPKEDYVHLSVGGKEVLLRDLQEEKIKRGATVTLRVPPSLAHSKVVPLIQELYDLGYYIEVATN